MTAIYGPGERLVAVAVDGLDGPRVKVGDVELIARVPSEARADIHELARRQGAEVRVNWSGDPQIAVWGVSMGAEQEWVPHPKGYAARTDTALSSALLVAPELAQDPYGAAPVIAWQDVREKTANPGAWPVRPVVDRPRWEWTPLRGVGPLRFGMSPPQVAAALGGEAPAARRGHFPYPFYRRSGQWMLDEDEFPGTGVTAHYWNRDGGPTLAAVTVDGCAGPQVAFDGLDLIGGSVVAIGDALVRRAENEEMELLVGCGGDMGPDGLNMYVRAARAGDAFVSEARFCTADWDDHG
ncbi:hypothetical protein OG730_40240 [Streptomyces sp. NBC_01298]|uniref:hypothetical protein n=1 Tax=Streptomyces sp. NBC_01298 TaxID=2903817 RepID=UPI002E130950|nr:hypothetical protein OG730_40240 [Streptomyces sp. NBC_01298]